MKLQQVNIDKILAEYIRPSIFMNEIRYVITRTTGKDKEMMQDLLMYYNNVFMVEVDVELDAINLYDIVFPAIERLRLLHVNRGFKVCGLLSELTAININYVNNYRRLG